MSCGLRKMSRYIRFVEGGDSQDLRWLTGVITAASVMKDEGRLEPYQADILAATFTWLNDHLPCPPFRRHLASGKWSEDAVAWFLPGAKEAIGRMWDLIAVLKGHDVPVRVLRTARPGLIVYRDEFQIVAETPKRG
jgi:hypothetical protein